MSENERWERGQIWGGGGEVDKLEIVEPNP